MSFRQISYICLTALLCLPFSLNQASANDRMAGSDNTRHAKPHHSTSKKSPYLPIEKLDKHTDQTTLHINKKAAEGSGVYDDTSEKSMGSKLWDHSQYGKVKTYLGDISGHMEYRAFKTIIPRLLLTKADVSAFSKYHSPKDGEDLLTLRIETLLRIGLFKEAAELYTIQDTPPYNYRLAKAGVLALMGQGKTEIACLEVLAMQPRFADDLYWQSLHLMCLDAIGSSETESHRQTLQDSLKDKDTAQQAFATKKLYKIFKSIAAKAEYRFKPRNENDIADLNNVDAIPIFAFKKINYRVFEIRDLKELSPLSTAILLSSPDLQDHRKLPLITHNMNYGYFGTDRLIDFLENVYIPQIPKDTKNYDGEQIKLDYATIKGWKRLPYLYQALQKDTDTQAKTYLVTQALQLTAIYGHDAMRPFIPAALQIDPAEFNSEMIRDLLGILIISNHKIDEKWMLSIGKIHKDSITAPQSTNLLIALGISQDLNKVLSLGNEVKPINFKQLDKVYQKLIFMSYEKLDKSGKLHNYAHLDDYEKEMGLTSTEDYVMPVGDLLKALSQADNKNATAEKLLIITMILQNAQRHKLDSDVFGEVIHSLVTVGLTNEARFLVKEAILGL